MSIDLQVTLRELRVTYICSVNIDARLRSLGYLTNTSVKIIVVVEDDVMSDSPIDQQEKDSQIKTLLVCRPLLLLACCMDALNSWLE